MNVSLGTLYAWSVFVAPLEARFGWKRAETSMVFTIAVIVFALSFVVAGRIQDKFGPLFCSLAGGILVSLGFYLCAYTESLGYLYVCFGVIGGLGNGFGDATPIPVMAKWFPDKRGLAVGLAVGGYGAGSAIFGPGVTRTDPGLRAAGDISDFRCNFPGDDGRGSAAAAESSGGLLASGRSPEAQNKRRIGAGIYTGRDAEDADLLPDVGRICAGLLRGVDGDQPTGAVRQKRGDRGGGAFDHDAGGGRVWKRCRADPIGVDVGQLGAHQRAADDDRDMRGGDAGIVPAGSNVALLYAAVFVVIGCYGTHIP